MEIKFLPGEVFYGGAVLDGSNQPYTEESERELDLRSNPTPNQVMPLFVSTKGRWFWNPDGMVVTFSQGTIHFSEEVHLGETQGGLKEAYLDAMARCFPQHPVKLDESLFIHPVYNTWIELTFYQSQEGVLNYAQDVLDHGLKPSVIMIDDGWSDYYGKWTFSKEKFSDPEKMLQELHHMGFKVMVWVCPFITPDTLEYRELEKAGLLVTDKTGEVYISHWWNGWSAVLDMTKEAACDWLKKQLDDLQAMGVDGFKFDAGDSIYYPEEGIVSGDDHSKAWAKFGEAYRLNEYRVTTGAGGWSLMQRMCDKDHSWGSTGLGALIPDGIVQSLTGHPYLCPDMIGGGEYRNFYDQERLDAELVVRWAQIAALMPVMQFSAKPWRILPAEDFAKVKEAIALREKYMPLIKEALDYSRETGEPMLRPMAYDFPEEACKSVTDQFMLGTKLLVAPILEKGGRVRRAYFPEGRWQFHDGSEIRSTGDFYEVEIGKSTGVWEKID